MVQLTTSLNKVKTEQEMASTKKSSIDLDNDDFLSGSSSVKTEIASLSSQVIFLVLIYTFCEDDLVFSGVHTEDHCL